MHILKIAILYVCWKSITIKITFDPKEMSKINRKSNKTMISISKIKTISCFIETKAKQSEKCVDLVLALLNGVKLC